MPWLPAAVAKRLEVAFYASAARYVVHARLLAQLLAACQEVVLPVVLLKGMALAPTVYPTEAARPMRDLDVLVEQREAKRLEQLLLSLGWQPINTNPNRPPAWEWQFGGQQEFARQAAGGTVVLEVHWRAFKGGWARYASHWDHQSVWHDQVPLVFDGLPAARLSDVDTLLHAISHTAINHHFHQAPLRSLLDVDRIVRTYGGATLWRAFLERTRCFRLQTASYVTLHLSWQLFSTPLPTDLLAALSPGPVRCNWLSKQLRPKRLLDGGLAFASGRAKFLLQLMLVDRPDDMARLLWRTFVPETEWLHTVYGLHLHSRGQLWRHRLSHPLRVILRGEM